MGGEFGKYILDSYEKWVGLWFHQGSWDPPYVGRAIKRTIGSVGFHDGICAIHNGRRVVVEAQPWGIVPTQVNRKENTRSWYLLLKPNVDDNVWRQFNRDIAFRAKRKLGGKYDFKAILFLLLKSRFKWLPILDWRWKWYCTELCLHAYEPLVNRLQMTGLLKTELLPDRHNKPTPYHVEKAMRAGMLRCVGGGGENYKKALNMILGNGS